MKAKKNISIVGGGVCALMLACELNTNLFDVALYEANFALGRKFLVAGDGGLNITHSLAPQEFIKKYKPSYFIEPAFSSFNNSDLQTWLKTKLNIETFKGSSGKIFPLKGIKPIEVINKFISLITTKNITIKTQHKWLGFNGKQLQFEHNNTKLNVQSDIVIFCLGGASWPVTGSNGSWIEHFKLLGIKTNLFKASNCSFKINWNKNTINFLEGKALKNCKFTVNNISSLGEAVITSFGIEGNGVYPLSYIIREELEKNKKAELVIDFKPNVTKENLLKKFKTSKQKTITKKLKVDLNLSELQIELLKLYLNKIEFNTEHLIINKIKSFNISITGLGNIEDAISTVGGIDLEEITPNFELKKLPNVYAIGEMLDYDAPTGGYLLQSCFSMAYFLSNNLNTKLFRK